VTDVLAARNPMEAYLTVMAWGALTPLPASQSSRAAASADPSRTQGKESWAMLP
jgi:hypothetical protein